MNINHITFADFDDLQLAHESKMSIKLDRFHAMLNSNEQEEAARVVFYGHDGNDYAVVDAGGVFWLIALTSGTDGFGDFVAFTEFSTLGAALEEIQAICETDYDTQAR